MSAMINGTSNLRPEQCDCPYRASVVSCSGHLVRIDKSAQSNLTSVAALFTFLADSHHKPQVCDIGLNSIIFTKIRVSKVPKNKKVNPKNKTIKL